MAIYLDEGATTKPRSEVVEAMAPYLTEMWYNPSALYFNAVKVKKDIEDARKIVGDFINADTNEIFFTSCGSESNCWAIQGFVNNRISNGRIPVIITSEVEHKSIIECVDNQSLAIVAYVGVDRRCVVSVQDIEDLIIALIEEGADPENILVSIQFANNEVGTVQDVYSISNVVHKYGAVFHTDAVQAFGHIDIDVKNFGIDMLSASGHKMGVPKGIGILYKRKDIEINPLVYGSQMDGMRGGTENVAGIVGFAKAVELANETVKNASNIAKKRDYFISELCVIGCKSNGLDVARLPNNISVTLPNNIDAESFVYALDTSRIMVATGSACNSKAISASHVLIAMGMNEEAKSVIRITFSDDIDIAAIDKVVKEFKTTIKLLS